MKFMLWSLAAASLLMFQGCSLESAAEEHMTSARINLSNEASFMKTAEGAVTLEALIMHEQDDAFQLAQHDSFSFGLTNQDIWIRLHLSQFIEDSEGTVPMELYLNFSALSDVTFYVPRSSESGPYYETLKRGPSAGREAPQADRLYPGILIPEDISAESPVYIRINTYTTANFQIFLEKSESYQVFTLRMTALLIFLLGLIVSVMVYNSILYISIKKLSYLFYSLYTLLFIAYLIDVTGLIVIVAPQMIYSPRFSGILIAYPLIAVYLAFVWTFLDLQRCMSKLFVLFIASWAISSAGVLFVLTGAVMPANLAAFIFATGAALLVFSSLIISIRRGYWVSKFYFFAVFFLMGNLLMYTLRGLGIIPHTFITNHSVFVFAALEATFLSFALSSHYRRIHQDNVSLLKQEQEHYAWRIKAESESHAKSSFLSRMSHEIRTPLNGIIGFTDMLIRTPLKGVQQQYAESISSSAKSLLDIVNDILDVSKIQAGKMKLEYVLSDITETVESAVDLMKFPAAEKQLEFILSIDPDLPRYAAADPYRLRQVLVNIISNAVKFTSSGEVEVSASFRAAGEGKGIYTFSVRDTGIGISEDERCRVFDSFSQGDETIARKFGGTGLGLVIAKNLSKLMGAELDFTSIKGGGSTFVFSLPAEVHDQPRYIQKKLQPGTLIYIADNHQQTLLVLRTALEAAGAEVVCFSSKEDLLNALESSAECSMLVLDMHISESSGTDILRQIRGRMGLSARRLPVCMLHSAVDDEQDFGQCELLGVSFQLVKPVRTWELVKCAAISQKDPSLELTSQQFSERKPISPMSYTPLKVVLAENNEMNALLFRENLKQYLPYAQIFEAYDGRTAVQLYTSAVPDIIFMDVYMPGMDGLQAAQEIRRIEGNTNEHVPIIAVSAKAFLFDEQRCRDAGMDAFISKPLKQGQLQDVLGTYFIKDAVLDLEKPETEMQQQSVQYSVTDLPGIDYEEALERFSGNQELYTNMLEQFVSSFRNFPGQIRTLLESGDYSQTAEQLHTFRGLTSNLSATRLYSISSCMYKHLHDSVPELPKLLDLVKDLDEEMQKIIHSSQVVTGNAGNRTS